MVPGMVALVQVGPEFLTVYHEVRVVHGARDEASHEIREDREAQIQTMQHSIQAWWSVCMRARCFFSYVQYLNVILEGFRRWLLACCLCWTILGLIFKTLNVSACLFPCLRAS